MVDIPDVAAALLFVFVFCSILVLAILAAETDVKPVYRITCLVILILFLALLGVFFGYQIGSYNA